MEYLIEFGISVFLVFFYYYIFVIRRTKKYNEEHLPTEVLLVVRWSKVDFKKVSYKKILWHVAIINSIIVGLILLSTNLVSNFLGKLGFACGLVFIMIILENYLLGLIYKKKGWTK